MGESDWLERGHGGGDGLRPMIKGVAGRASDRVSIRSVLRGGDVRSPRKSRRRTKILVGWFVYCGIAVGGTAAAFTVRDTLFPQLGGPSKALWVSPTPEVPLTTEHGVSSTEGDDTTPIAVQAAAVVAAETAGPASSDDAQTVPSASSPDADQGNTNANRGPSANAGPSTGTSVSPGPGGDQGHGGDHGTIVDESPTVPPSSEPGTSADPTTTVSTTGSTTPGPTTTDPDSDGGKGKGGGGGGGGGGSGGDGGRNTSPPSTTTP